MKRLFLAVSIMVTAFVALIGTALAEENWITKTSPHSVAETADKLVAAIEKAGPKVFARIDHAAGAKSAGLELEPTTLILFGNPKMGTPIMKADRRAGIDLPVRVLIWSEGGKTMLGAVSPDGLKTRYKLDGAEKPLAMMNGALNKLMDAATK